jgi:flavin-dependent dehydrogenase
MVDAVPALCRAATRVKVDAAATRVKVDAAATRVTMHPALIIGGGLAGAALARHLAEAGRPVLLIEREAGPHDKVCGEFLSDEAIRYLRAAGLDPMALGAVPVTEVAVAGAGPQRRAGLPFPALSLSRRVLDEALLDHARAAGAQVRRGVAVRTLRRVGDAWHARLGADGEEIRARDVFLATGKHDLRGWGRPPGTQPDLLGFKLHLRLHPSQAEELGRAVEIALFPDGYAGLQAVGETDANLCLLVRRGAFARLGRAWPALLSRIAETSPHLGRRLADSVPLRPRPLALAGIPYGHVQRTSDGLWRLGDQAAVIPSFAGEGMSMALHSARLAADTWLAGEDAATYQARMAGDVGAMVGRATWLSRGMVGAMGPALVMAALRVAPGALTRTATLTRLPGHVLRLPATAAGVGHARVGRAHDPRIR